MDLRDSGEGSMVGQLTCDSVSEETWLCLSKVLFLFSDTPASTAHDSC